ncbi:MAG: DUF503 domain-containing protein [Deltaproteobacteria bacterium]|nr:DUF503 domain-containing protein [Deltaproteobacteria bacterium]
MIVGVLEITLALEGNHSLKDKRKVVKSLLGRVGARFNASCAEVDLPDLHDRAVLGFSVCGGDAKVLESVLDHILNFVLSVSPAEVLDSRSECLKFS